MACPNYPSTSHDANSFEFDETVPSKSATDTKYFIQVAHHNFPDLFNQAGVKVCNRGSSLFFKKSISPIDGTSDRFYEIMYSHLIVIENNAGLKGVFETNIYLPKVFFHSTIILLM